MRQIGSVLGVLVAGAFTVLTITGALTFVVLLVLDVLLAARSALFDVAGESALKEVVPSAAMAVCHGIAALTAALILRLRAPAGGSAAEAPAAGGGEGAEKAAAAPAAARNAAREIREGVVWLFSRVDLRGVLLVMTIVNLGINAALTTVVYALQQDGRSPAVIGWLSAGMGIAMLLGAVFSGALVTRVGAGALMGAGLLVLTAGAAATALVTDPLPIVLIIAVPGLLLPAINASMMGYFMVATPSAMLGRANSATMMFGMGATPLAPLIAGVGLAAIGREATILVSAGLCGIAAILALTNRSLRSLPAEAGWAAHAERFAIREPAGMR